MITMYTKDGCPVCEDMASLLSMNEYPYEIKKIGRDVDREFILENFPDMKTVPIVHIGTSYGDSSVLLDYIEMQQIENIL